MVLYALEKALPVILMVGVCMASACRMTHGGSREAIDITMHAGGALAVEGRPADYRDLVKTIRSLGAGPNTRVVIEIPVDARPENIQELSRALARGGFHKLLFRKPQSARAVAE
ncbi:MAG: hypothetical protein JW951_07700 [Lentisphaerae bacterium]|nr:hypothetical protein [Lentisphaerota bacterium]